MTTEATRVPFTANDTDDHLQGMCQLATAHESAVAGYWTGDPYSFHRKDVIGALSLAALAYGFQLVPVEKHS